MYPSDILRVFLSHIERLCEPHQAFNDHFVHYHYELSIYIVSLSLSIYHRLRLALA